MLNVPPETFARLQKHAVPLVDTFDTVINRALDALENAGATQPQPSGSKVLNPDAPPSLAFTTVRTIVFEGQKLPPTQTYWNTLLYAVVREAAKTMPAQKLTAALPLNCVVGQKDDNGYRFIPDAGISVQGQSADAAWKGIYSLAKTCNFSVEVAFVWQHNPKAAYPGESGTLSLK